MVAVAVAEQYLEAMKKPDLVFQTPENIAQLESMAKELIPESQASGPIN